MNKLRILNEGGVVKERAHRVYGSFEESRVVELQLQSLVSSHFIESIHKKVSNQSRRLIE